MSRKFPRNKDVSPYDKAKDNKTFAKVGEAKITYSIPVAVPGIGVCAVHKAFNITKPYSVWMRLAENPPQILT